VAVRWPLGSTVAIRLSVVSQASGAPVDLSLGTAPNLTVVRFKARKQPLPLYQPLLLDIIGTLPVPYVLGQSIITITPTMQRMVLEQNIFRAFYDIWITLPDGSHNAIIPTSPLYFEPAVTEFF
jgi:hypothetical protein